MGSRARVRTASPSTWAAALAGTAVAGAIVLAMSPASAEAASTTTTLTLTGMVSSTCDLGAGGTVAYVARGGTMTIKASLAGASVKLPVLGAVPLDSAHLASFVDEVTIDTTKHTLRTPSDSIVLRHVEGTHTISWKATAVSLLGGIGTVRLSPGNVVGGELDWSGKIVGSASTDCGIAVSVPTTKLHAGTHTVTVPGADVSLPNPVPSLLDKLPKPPAAGSGTVSQRPSGALDYTPPGVTVPQQVMPHAVNYGGVGGTGGSGGTGAAAGGGGAVAPAGGRTAGSPTPTTSPAAKIKPGAGGDLGQHDRLGGAQLPVLLAIAAILALFTVSAMWARTQLLRHLR
jgi:hypothetical protein